MRLRLRLDGRHPRRWHLLLLDRMRAIPGIELDVDFAPAAGGLSRPDALALRIDGLVGGAAPSGVSASVPLASVAVHAQAVTSRPDVILDLCGDAIEIPGAQIWRLVFDGAAGESALLSALRAGRSPVAALTEGVRTIAAARLGTESRGAMLASFDDGLARTITLIVAALTTAGPPCVSVDRALAAIAAPVPMTAGALGTWAIRMAAWSAIRHVYRGLYRSPHWRVGWRHLDGADVIDLRAHPASGWHDLPDDGTRFYADPFPVDHEGRTILFVEDYEHARGKAVISAVTFDRGGPVGVPVPVLDEPYHLSYPFVFPADGTWWMIPESGANRTVDLYRATAFPGGWVKQATLLSGLTASDATLVEHAGLWWMFATVREIAAGDPPPVPAGSYSDALYLWSAPDFRGPWRPHAQNPVLIDIAAARPAGRIVAHRGGLVRPVQDCRLGYGDALSLARIDRLDEAGFAQTVETTLRAGPSWPGRRLHTLNRSRDFEFIDGSGLAPRFWKHRVKRSGYTD